MQIETFLANTNSFENEYLSITDLNESFISINSEKAFSVLNNLLTENKGKFLNGTIVIQSNYKTFLTFVDWDDLDLMWPAVLRMTLEFLENGQEGTTEHFSNGLELGIKLIQPIKDKKVLFSVKRSSAFFNQGIDLPIEKENKDVIELNTFLNTVIKSAEDYLNFRDLDGRSHNLSAAKSELEEIKEIIKSLV